MILYKICRYKPCGKRYERPEGFTNRNWEISRYCCTAHQRKQNNLNKSKKARANKPKFKYCPDCGAEKHVYLFNRCATKADKLQTYCKEHQAKRYLAAKPERSTRYGNSDLMRDMQKSQYLQPLLSMRW